MSFDQGFDDVLDMSSYAADDSTSLEDAGPFVNSSLDQFHTHPPVEPIFSGIQGNVARTPSPFATYPGAVAPFSAPGTFYARHASPASARHADATVAGSSLATTADLIHQGRAQQQAGQPTQWNHFFGPTASSSSGSTTSASVNGPGPQDAALAPGLLYPPNTLERGGPTMTITPSIISAPIHDRESTSGSRESTPRPTAAPSRKASTNPSSAKSARSASPAVAKRVAPTAATAYSPEHWTSFAPKVRTYLDSKRLQRAPVAAAQFLVRNLHGLFTYADRSSTSSPWGDASDVPPEGRAEVLSALVSYARDEFWRAWLDEGIVSGPASASSKGKEKEKEKEKDRAVEGGKSDGLELLQCWLEGASQRVAMSSKDKEALAAGKVNTSKDRNVKELEAATLGLVLQALYKLPLSFDHLKTHMAIPKRVKRISERATDSFVKSRALELVAKWSKVQAAAHASSTTAAAGAPSKRKADDASGTAKKAKTATTSSTTPATAPVAVKKVVTPAPNPLAKSMPSFKKQPAAGASAVGAGGTSALMEAIAKVKAGSGPKPPPPPPPAAAAPATNPPGKGADTAVAATSSAPAAPHRTGTGKPGGTLGNGGGPRARKSVRWAAGEELEKVKLIEKAIYGDEDGNEIGGPTVTVEGESLDDSLQLMQEQEGMSLAMHFEEELEELIDWYEPAAVTLPETPEFAVLSEPKQSHELELYPDGGADVPMEIDLSGDSLAEPQSESLKAGDSASATSEPAGKVKEIPLAADMANDPEVLQTIEAAQMSRAGAFASSDQISALLSQLTANGVLGGAGGLNVPGAGLGGPGGVGNNGGSENPHAPPFGAGPPTGPQVEPPPIQITAEALEALRSYPSEQVAAIVQANPGLAGLNLAALGIAFSGGGLPPAGPTGPDSTLGGYDAPTHVQQHGGFHSTGHAQPPQYAGYAPPAPSWGAPSGGPTGDAYNGYQPPPGAIGGGYGFPPSGAAHPTSSALPPPSGRKALRSRKDVPCKYFRGRGRCDWGDRCAFSHDM